MLSSVPIFFAEADSASLVETVISTGLALRRCDLTAIVTGVSVMPQASFASVFPVHGATISRSNIFFGPIGSACGMVLITPLPQMFSAVMMFSSAVPKRVSSEEALYDIMGVSSAPAAFSFIICSNALEKVQNEPHMANPIFAPLRGDMLSVKMFTSL